MIVMTVKSASLQGDDGVGADPGRIWVERIGSDWWAVIVVGVLTALAVGDLLPKIPW